MSSGRSRIVMIFVEAQLYLATILFESKFSQMISRNDEIVQRRGAFNERHIDTTANWGNSFLSSLYFPGRDGSWVKDVMVPDLEVTSNVSELSHNASM